MVRFHFITLFPEACEPYMSASILGRARKNKKIEVTYQNPRDFTDGALEQKKTGKWKYGGVDGKPYGGGPGMVMQALPVVKAAEKSLGKKKTKAAIVWFSPSAKQFTNADAEKLAKFSDVVFVCGRYEGIDARAKKILKTLGTLKEYAVGEAIYTGGEVPALAIADATTRRIKGVLGDDASVEERRIASADVYTRPESISYKKKAYKVPAVLKTGHHQKIEDWKKTKRPKGA